MLKILIVSPDSLPGQPISERSDAYARHFLVRYQTYARRAFPKNLVELVSLVRDSRTSEKTIFVMSMPPFRNWLLFFMPRINIILDIRDGWSIAMKTGYGDTSDRSKIKAFIAQRIERFAIRRSDMTITCTPGLVSYLQNVSGKPVYFLPNGISKESFELIQRVRRSKLRAHEQIENSLVFMCAGKFSEYGQEKVKKIIDVISSRYPDNQCILQIVGANELKNEWIKSYLVENGFDSIDYECLPRKRPEELYKMLVRADYAISVIRDPDYEFGTKIFDYIACGTPVINYFDAPNSFTEYFDGVFDVNFGGSSGFQHPLLREDHIERLAHSIDEVVAGK